MGSKNPSTKLRDIEMKTSNATITVDNESFSVEVKNTFHGLDIVDTTEMGLVYINNESRIHKALNRADEMAGELYDAANLAAGIYEADGEFKNVTVKLFAVEAG